MTDRDRLAVKICKATQKTNFACKEAKCVGKGLCAHCYVMADNLLANGIIAPPCKVGDWVYVVTQGQGLCMRWNVYEGKVVDIHLNRHNELTVRVENGEKFFGYYKPCFIHKTKEEAEEKLKELGNNAV